MPYPKEALSWIRWSTFFLVPSGMVSYHCHRYFTPSVLPDYTLPRDLERKTLANELVEHNRLFPPWHNTPFTQYTPRRFDNSWRIRYEKGKNMWWWWDRLSSWACIYSAFGYQCASVYLAKWRLAMGATPIGLGFILCQVAFIGCFVIVQSETIYRAGIVKTLYERVKAEDEEGQQPAHEAQDDMDDPWAATADSDTQKAHGDL